ncbi:hypothetical protein QE152_g25314 [Popillia japonica]|uniref:Uncharacterized protein n=1 Tax=Popillia japonica TaxID=7064 RepID=A0AAW1K1W5_POPJA
MQWLILGWSDLKGVHMSSYQEESPRVVTDKKKLKKNAMVDLGLVRPERSAYEQLPRRITELKNAKAGLRGYRKVLVFPPTDIGDESWGSAKKYHPWKKKSQPGDSEAKNEIA